MCGIIGFVGNEPAAPILLDGLERMEYRGYDSAGVAVRSETAGLQVRKTKGRLQVLSDLIHGGADLEGNLGIGHTRWAVVKHVHAVGGEDSDLPIVHVHHVPGVLDDRQPEAVRKTISPRIRDGRVVLDDLHLTAEYVRDLSRIYVIASRHVGGDEVAVLTVADDEGAVLPGGNEGVGVMCPQRRRAATPTSWPRRSWSSRRRSARPSPPASGTAVWC